ncbi:MAG: hypothetical protein SO022_12660 [Selenomonadaceae bacterium]|nr:hypothetical protein [Selenomonadaceae bacterium]
MVKVTGIQKNINYKLAIKCIIILILSCMMISIASSYSDNYKNMIVNLVNLLMITILVRKIILYNYCNKKMYLVMILLLMFSFSPFIYNDFYYFDDLWSFSRVEYNKIGIAAQRPFIDLYINMAYPLSIEYTSVFRTITIIVQSLYAISIYTFFSNVLKSKAISIFLSIVFSCSVLVVDIIGYMAIFPVVLSNIYTLYSYIVFKDGYEKCNIRYHCYLYSMIFFIAACMYYPIITPMFFVYALIDRYFERLYSAKYYIHLFGEYVISTAVYLSVTRALLYLFGVSASSRAVIIDTYDGFIAKINWFIMDVIPTCFTHIFALFTGNTFLELNCMFYTVKISNHPFRYVIMTIIMTLILYYFYKLYKMKNYILILYSLVIIPMTFMYWLILSESTIITYYLLALNYLLILMMFLGLYSYLKSKNKVLIILSLLILASSNIYAGSFWVEYNQYSYNFIKSTIASNINSYTKRIHIYGKLNPYQINSYAIMATNLALKDLGIEENKINVTASDDEKIITGLTHEEGEELCNKLDSDSLKIFNKYYQRNTDYAIYTMRENIEGEYNQEELTKVLILGGALPDKNSNDVIIVDLNKGFHQLYKF